MTDKDDKKSPKRRKNKINILNDSFCLHQRYRYWTCHFWRRIISGEISLGFFIIFLNSRFYNQWYR